MKKDDPEVNDKAGNGSRSSGKDSSTKKDRAHDALAVVRVFLNVRNGTWILTVFFIGLCNGLIWGFLFWHLDNLGNYHYCVSFACSDHTDKKKQLGLPVC